MSDPNAVRLVPILAALGQETRLEILARVAEAGVQGLAAGEIARSIHCPASTLSFHLKELSRAGVLEARPQGRFIIYGLRKEALEVLARFIAGLAGAEPATRSARPGGKTPRRRRASDRSQLSIFGD